MRNVKPFVDKRRKHRSLSLSEPAYPAIMHALELRFAIEEIAYDKLKLRLRVVLRNEIAEVAAR